MGGDQPGGGRTWRTTTSVGNDNTNGTKSSGIRMILRCMPAGIPLLLLLFVFIGAPGCTDGSHTDAAQQTVPSESSGQHAAKEVNGERIYLQRCSACHLTDGTGIPGQIPPLAGSAWTNGDPELPIRIVLHGMTGRVTHQGKSYEGVMPGWQGRLTPAEIAAVLTYIRSSWGNAAPAVDTATVRNTQRKFADRTALWQVEELTAE